MKIKFKILFHLLFIGSLVAFSQNAEKNFIDQPYIEVTGTYETEITPNEIYLNIVLSEHVNKGRVSIEAQENNMLNALRTLKIDLEKNLSVRDFRGFYKRKIFKDNEVTKTKRYQLLVNNGKMLGDVYMALDELHISNISIEKVSHSELEELTRETKLKALKAAKEKANAYAETINQSLGKAIYIQEQNFNGQNMAGYVNGLNMREVVTKSNYKSFEGKITNLNFEALKISASILAKFILN